MEIIENSFLEWSKKIPSDSRTINLLGIYQHLRIQREFVPAITSVTNRIRYYTLRAFYWEYINKEDINSKDFEKIFILTCLAHHDGEDRNPHLNSVFNKTKFKKDWDKKNSFDLKFQILGNAANYYNRQMEILRCAWTDELNRPTFSSINKQLARSLGKFPISFFKKKTFTKPELKEFGENGFCICSLEHNLDEIEIMSKLLFGFYKLINLGWEINEEEYQSFIGGDINLDFSGQNDFVFDEERIIEQNKRRRNTLFMYLKIIEKTNPTNKNNLEFKRSIWDGIYFSQNRKDNSYINFGRLEKIRKYWEFFQLNVYYVYIIEKFLDVIQFIVANNSGIDKDKVFDQLVEEELINHLFSILKEKLNGPSTISNLTETIDNVNGSSETNLDSNINEAKLFEILYNSDSNEEKISTILIFLMLLYNRYNQIEEEIREYNRWDGDEDIGSLSITSMVNFIKLNPDKTINEYLKDICKLVINKHLYETAIRLSTGTKNWIFLEENNKLYFERKNYVWFGPQDNRWFSIRNLLYDLQFIQYADDKVNITDKGLKWLERIT